MVDPRAVPLVLLALTLFAGCGDDPPARQQPDADAGYGAPPDDAGPTPSGPARLDGGKGEAASASPEVDGAPGSGHAPEGGAAGGDAGSARDADSARGDAAGAADVPDRTLTQTLVIEAGAIFDGQGGRFLAGPALGDGSQSESQKPLFKLEDGATLVNVVLGAPAADGIHTYGDALLENIVWEDIGEDALTIKEPGEVTLRGGSARDGADKIFQINAPSTFRVFDFRASNAGKFIRQNGGTEFEVRVFIEACDISQMKEAIFRTDSPLSTVSMVDTRYSEIGDELFLGVSPQNITERNNTAY